MRYDGSSGNRPGSLQHQAVICHLLQLRREEASQQALQEVWLKMHLGDMLELVKE